MVGFALGFLSKYWKLIAIGFAVLSVAFAITLMVRNYNDAIEDKIRAEELAEKWEAKSNGWQASFTESENLREQEARQAISSLEQERVVCNKRVADALQTRERINTITRVVPNESNEICPAAGSISTDELRDALGAR